MDRVGLGISGSRLSHGHKTTGLARHLPLDWVTLLPGHGVTPLLRHMDCDVEGDIGAGGDRLGGADSLWHLLGHGDTLGLGNLDTDGVGDIPADHGALLSGNRGALGHGDTVGDVDTWHNMWVKSKYFDEMTLYLQ